LLTLASKSAVGFAATACFCVLPSWINFATRIAHRDSHLTMRDDGRLVGFGICRKANGRIAASTVNIDLL